MRVMVQLTDGRTQRLDQLPVEEANKFLADARVVTLLDETGDHSQTLTHLVESNRWRMGGQDADEADLPDCFDAGNFKLYRPKGGEGWCCRS